MKQLIKDILAKDSKVWDILLIVALGGVLKLNASNFDETELKALAEFAAIFIGYKHLRD